jgi:hypothetical protein
MLMTIEELLYFIQNHLEFNPFPDMPVRIRIADKEADIKLIATSDTHISLVGDPNDFQPFPS